MKNESQRPAAWHWVVEFLVCPLCRRPLEFVADTSDQREGILRHHDRSCSELYPVIGAVPRLLLGPARGELVRQRRSWFEPAERQRLFETWRQAGPKAELGLVQRFDLEWSRFSDAQTTEQRDLFGQYFDLVPQQHVGPGTIALDAGCGAGRWAAQLVRVGPRVIAVDLGLSTEVARANVSDEGALAVVQADITTMPVRDGTVDLAYSLGVLHHVDQTEAALLAIRRTLRSGGLFLIYLYYALEQRSIAYRMAFRVADLIRRGTVRLPYRLLLGTTFLFALLLYWPAARVARLLRGLGLARLARGIPLSFYSDLSFRTMWNDSLDRFGTALEKRFTKAEVIELLADAGLVRVRISDAPPYWHGIGYAPPAGGGLP